MQVLSQLSYSPREFKIGCSVDAGPLRVSSGRYSKVDLSPARNQSAGEKIAAVKVAAVHGHEVNLVLGVVGAHVSLRRKPGALQTDSDGAHGLVEGPPL